MEPMDTRDQLNPELIALDPLFMTPAKLLIMDILVLKQTENVPIELYNLYNHIIKFVEMCGILVGVERRATQIYYTVDDGTGTLNCVLWNNQFEFNEAPLALGTFVRVHGRLSTYQERKLVTIHDAIEDPNIELIHFLEAMTLKKEYAKPYELPQDGAIEISIEKAKRQRRPPSNAVDKENMDHLHYCLIPYLEETFGYEPFLENNQALQDFAKQLLLKKNGEQNYAHIVRLALNRLVDQHQLEKLQNDTYRLINLEKLQYIVFNEIETVCKENRSRLLGVSRDYLIRKLDKSHRLKRKDVLVALNALHNDTCRISCSGNKEYRVVHYG